MNMNKDSEYILNSLLNLEKYAKSQEYSGFDPYDALNSKVLNRFKNKFVKLAFTQLFVYSPINFRYFLQMNPEKNPKAIGIFLQAYCKMLKSGTIEENYFKTVHNELVNFLLKNSSMGYSGYCWGFNFDWQDLTRYSKKHLPTIVVTSYIANSFLDLYEITKDERHLKIATSSCRFLLNDLHITENEEGICFSYTPIDKLVVHNANLLGAALLARVYSITKERKLLDYSIKAFDFSLSSQRNDGSWAYSSDIVNGGERNQIDFHQGFILDSICNLLNYVKPNDKKYEKALMKGVRFYMKNQFDKSGRSKWRLPWNWPVDAHNQAQGIITFSKLYGLTKEKNYLAFSRKITLWTVNNMQDKSGYFYYQKWPLLINKIPYMRWGQAWMMLALAEYVYCSQK